MFESAELGHAASPETYDAEVPGLRERLLRAQADVFRKKQFPVVVIVSGFEGAGKGDTIQTLNEWMDPRHMQTRAFDEPDCVERAHPPMWRYWQALPRTGDVGLFFGAWYRSALYGRVYGGEKRADLARHLEEIVRFEQMLTDEGALVVKYWLHLSKKAQKKVLTALTDDRRTRWRVKNTDWRNHERYADFREVAEQVIQRTSSNHAPWIVVEGTDAHYRRLTVARTLLDAMRLRLGEPAHMHARAAPIVPAVDNRKLLRDLDLKKALDKKDYDERLAKAQGELAVLSRAATKRKRAILLAFEGSDAAGKGGVIRRITAPLDARHFKVHGVSAPSEEERAYPYLWRFWRGIPRGGETVIFDRTWYGRVLVERVEELSPEPVWMRAYAEINDFESQLVGHGVIVLKFWLAISKEEQLRRFHSREDEGYKRFKLTREDWRNRKKSSAYEQAACDMFDRTNTRAAPWTLVEANDKPFARVKVLETIVKRLRDEL